MNNLINVEQAMKQADNLAQDHAWNGDEKLYRVWRKRYQYYKQLLEDGILYEPRF